MEATQLAVCDGGGMKLDLLSHGPRITTAAVRGAGVGAVGASLAFMFGPVAPTAILVGYGIGREVTEQTWGWYRNEISANHAAGKAFEALLGATGGVTAAWATAMVLSG